MVSDMENIWIKIKFVHMNNLLRKQKLQLLVGNLHQYKYVNVVNWKMAFIYNRAQILEHYFL